MKSMMIAVATCWTFLIAAGQPHFELVMQEQEPLRQEISSLKQLCMNVIAANALDFRKLPKYLHNEALISVHDEYSRCAESARHELYIPKIEHEQYLFGCSWCDEDNNDPCPSECYNFQVTAPSQAVLKALALAQLLEPNAGQCVSCSRSMIGNYGMTPKRIGDCCACLPLLLTPCSFGSALYALIQGVLTKGSFFCPCVGCLCISVTAGLFVPAAFRGPMLDSWQRSLLPDIVPPAILTIDVPDAVPEEVSEQSTEDESAAEEEFLLG